VKLSDWVEDMKKLSFRELEKHKDVVTEIPDVKHWGIRYWGKLDSGTGRVLITIEDREDYNKRKFF